MQQQTTTDNLLQVRQQITEIENNADENSLIGMFKRAALTTVDYQTRLFSDVKNLIVHRDDQQVLTLNETFDLIRRQYKDLEREKANLIQQQSSQEQTFQLEIEKLTAEKE